MDKCGQFLQHVFALCKIDPNVLPCLDNQDRQIFANFIEETGSLKQVNLLQALKLWLICTALFASVRIS